MSWSMGKLFPNMNLCRQSASALVFSPSCGDAAECPKPGSAHTGWAIVLTRQGEPWIPIPDITYISNERLPIEAMADEPCSAIPELVVEILSPDQSFGAALQKAAGIPRVWIVDPQAKSITVFYPDAPPKTFTGSQAIQEDFLPGLKVVPQDVFAQARIP